MTSNNKSSEDWISLSFAVSAVCVSIGVFLWTSSAVCVFGPRQAQWCGGQISQLPCSSASGHHAWLALSMSPTDAPGTFHLYLSVFPSAHPSVSLVCPLFSLLYLPLVCDLFPPNDLSFGMIYVSVCMCVNVKM